MNLIGCIYYQPHTERIMVVNDKISRMYFCDYGNHEGINQLMFRKWFKQDGWFCVGRI